MNVTESFLTAVDRLLANKLRAMLTMLGVIIGVSAVIQGTQEVVYNGRSSRITVSGVTANYFTVNNLNDFQSGDGFASNGEAVYVPLTTAQSRLYPPFGPAPVKKGRVGDYGLIFGIYPAWRAAGLQPIEALRYE